MGLTEIVRELEPRLLETLESIGITFDGSWAEAKLSFHLYPIRVVEVSTTTPIEDQIRALHASGLVGGLKATRYEGYAEPVWWLVKTHASSQAERVAWVQSLWRKSPLNKEETSESFSCNTWN